LFVSVLLVYLSSIVGGVRNVMMMTECFEIPADMACLRTGIDSERRLCLLVGVKRLCVIYHVLLALMPS